MIKRVLTALAATLLPLGAHAADAITGAVQRQPTNWQAIVMFLIFVAPVPASPAGSRSALA